MTTPTPTLTITEALAELKTIGKRVDSKSAAMLQYVYRQEGVRDPLEKTGGSEAYLRSESQSIRDLLARMVLLRAAISAANAATSITILSRTMTIANWLIWRREVAPIERAVLNKLSAQVASARQLAQRSGVIAAKPGEASQAADFVINLDEAALHTQSEELTEILGTLDGQLSLKNATVLVNL
jgi:hypothetical protein